MKKWLVVWIVMQVIGSNSAEAMCLPDPGEIVRAQVLRCDIAPGQSEAEGKQPPSSASEPPSDDPANPEVLVVSVRVDASLRLPCPPYYGECGGGGDDPPTWKFTDDEMAFLWMGGRASCNEMAAARRVMLHIDPPCCDEIQIPGPTPCKLSVAKVLDLKVHTPYGYRAPPSDRPEPDGQRERREVDRPASPRATEREPAPDGAAAPQAK